MGMNLFRFIREILCCCKKGLGDIDAMGDGYRLIAFTFALAFTLYQTDNQLC